MVELHAIWNRARADLMVKTDHGEPDVFLWEHSDQVARTARRIAQLPELRSRPANETALVAAALYHDAGWITLLKEGRVSRLEICPRSRFENHRELGALMMEKRLAKMLSPESLRCASAAIRTIHDRDIDTIEGQIVTEAENLNEVGALALWPIIRRGSLGGKSLQSFIETWHRQKEYRFWTARINESFRFETVKELARKRLALFDRFIEQLEQQHACADLVV